MVRIGHVNCQDGVTGRSNGAAEGDGDMMDIEAFVQEDGRDELVKQVRSKIDELGIQYLYMQFVSITGRICGKGIPSDHWEACCRKAAFNSSMARPSISS